MEVWGNNRSVMPLDVLGRTRATMIHSTSIQPWPIGLGNLLKVYHDWDRWLQFFIFNEECLVNASHQLALITSLPFVHTARRSYRWMIRWKLWIRHSARTFVSYWMIWELAWTLSFRGRRSRNKVSVGEPAEGSLAWIICSMDVSGVRKKVVPFCLQLIV